MTEGTRARVVIIDDPYSVAKSIMETGAGVGLPVLLAEQMDLDRFRLGDELHIVRICQPPEDRFNALDADRFAHLDAIECEDRSTPVPFRPHWPIPPRPGIVVEKPLSKRARRRARGRGRA